MYVQQPQIMLSNSYFAVFSRIRQTGNHFIEKRAGFQSKLFFSFARVCRKLVGFSKSLLTILCASQSYSPCVTKKTYKMCSDLSDSLWQKLAHFFKSEFRSGKQVLMTTRFWESELTFESYSISQKYAHGFCFAVLCCGYRLTDFPISIRLTSLALWQSNDCLSASKATLMNMDKYFMWIHYERLHNHNKVKHKKNVCIFLGIYCS